MRDAPEGKIVGSLLYIWFSHLGRGTARNRRRKGLVMVPPVPACLGETCIEIPAMWMIPDKVWKAGGPWTDGKKPVTPSPHTNTSAGYRNPSTSSNLLHMFPGKGREEGMWTTPRWQWRNRNRVADDRRTETTGAGDAKSFRPCIPYMYTVCAGEIRRTELLTSGNTQYGKHSGWDFFFAPYCFTIPDAIFPARKILPQTMIKSFSMLSDEA